MSMYTPTVPATSLNADKLPIMLNCKTIAEILDVSEKHIRDLARTGQLDGACKVGSAWRISRDKFLAQYQLV